MSNLIVHYMLEGRTPCNMPGVPKDWPENHKWESDWSVVNCRACLHSAPPKPQDKEPVSVGEALASVLPKLKPLSAQEARRRELEEQATLQQNARERTAELLASAGAPTRQLTAKALNVMGPWGEKLTKIASMLGTGFVVALIGVRGNGKTQLGVELIRHAAKQMKGSRYATATGFFMDVKATYRQDAKESERDVIGKYARRSLLVLDEIGKRGETDWEDRLLFELIDWRYRERRDTLLISNQDRTQFLDAVGPSIASRLQETGGIVECNWESFR